MASMYSNIFQGQIDRGLCHWPNRTKGHSIVQKSIILLLVTRLSINLMNAALLKVTLLNVVAPFWVIIKCGRSVAADTLKVNQMLVRLG
jgi:hypothetical protein